MYIKVNSVKPLNSKELLLTFSNGEVRKFDVSPYFETGVFSELKDTDLFNTVHISFDTISWQNEADFDPEFLYEVSVPL